MRPLPWRVAEEGIFHLGSRDRALAYAAEDGAFSLYNDYTTGTAVLRPAPDTAAPAEVAERRRVSAGVERPHRLAPPDTVEGYGIFTFPYGPISMGVPEAGRFDVRTYGERILGLVPVGGYKSRRIRTSVVGLSVADAALRIERIAGHLSASHVSAFLAAAESAQGLEVPTTELWIRALAQELQRIYNHLHVIARVAEAASQTVGIAQTHALAEDVLRLQGAMFGHRWLFGALLPSGPTRRLEPSHRRESRAALERIGAAFEDLWALFLESRIWVDRIQATGTVRRETAMRWGAVGPTLRACGISWDDRLRVPTPPYDDLYLSLPHEDAGDALARVVVRAEEVRASLLLIEQMLDRWPRGVGGSEASYPPVAPGRGVARVEAPSGDLVYDVGVENGRLTRVAFRSPSDANWPVFASGLRDGVFTDFHFAFESFGLSFAETDG